MRIFFVYILECSDNSYYIGVTSNIDGRLVDHQNGFDVNCYTYSRRPVKLVHSEEYKYVDQAIQREKQLKRWTRAKKQALIDKDYEKLEQLSGGKK
jgi:putative endonuclease